MEAAFALAIVAAAAVLLAAFGGIEDFLRDDDRRRGFAGDATRDRLAALLAASSGGHPSRVATYAIHRGKERVESGLQLAVEGLSTSVSLWRLGDPEPSSPPPSAPDLGDTEFDRAFRTAGARADALALFDAPTRAAVQSLIRGNVRVGRLRLEEGTLTVEIPTAGFATEHPGLDSAARAVGALAARLAAPGDVADRLARNVTADPQPGVRLASLAALLEDREADARTREAVRAALHDANDPVRLRAALAAGAAGRDVLVSLALDPSADDAISARAIEALGAELPLDRADLLVQAAARAPAEESARARTTRAFVEALGRSRSEEALLLLARLARTAHDSLGPLVVDLVAAGPRPTAERTLTAVIESRNLERGRTLEAAALRLGSIGTLDAVLPLQDLAIRHGGSVAAAARRSVGEIQARLAGTPGRLALAEADTGRLSLTTEEAGRVSVPPAEDDAPA